MNASAAALRNRKIQAVQGEATLKRGDSAPLIHSHETLPEVLLAALQSPGQVGHGPMGMSPEEARQDD